MNTLLRLDTMIGAFFHIEDIETRIKFYKAMFLISFAFLGFMYWNMVDVKSDIERVLKS
jgi:hypothetical protein